MEATLRTYAHPRLFAQGGLVEKTLGAAIGNTWDHAVPPNAHRKNGSTSGGDGSAADPFTDSGATTDADAS
jgi:hypothetical protein